MEARLKALESKWVGNGTLKSPALDLGCKIKRK